MLTRGQKLDIEAGRSVILDCEFNMDNFSDFENPIMWEKQKNGEKTLMNIQGSVQEPFAKTRRYDVKIHFNQAPRYRVPLKIQSISINLLFICLFNLLLNQTYDN